MVIIGITWHIGKLAELPKIASIYAYVQCNVCT